MIVLTAIGRFFKKIWDWIKQTAWIQPLLIVGIIFGIIFSIPAIVNAVNSKKDAKSTLSTYYNTHKLSLKNEADSEADKFTTDLEAVMDGGEKELADFKSAHSSLGDKFFVVFVDKSCTECDSAKEGFSTFESKLGVSDAFKVKNSKDTEKFNLVAIFTDDVNEDTNSAKEQTAFGEYLNRHLSFFETVGFIATETDYYKNGKLNEKTVDALTNADEKNMYAPTIFLVELGDVAKAYDNYQGVTEVMFGLPGSDKNAKADTLFDCWTHTGDFSTEAGD